eukprot:4440113-Pyramimonas_sp.AAC.1
MPKDAFDSRPFLAFDSIRLRLRFGGGGPPLRGPLPGPEVAHEHPAEGDAARPLLVTSAPNLHHVLLHQADHPTLWGGGVPRRMTVRVCVQRLELRGRDEVLPPQVAERLVG